MKYQCKECIDGMDIAAPPPAVDRMASSWRWKRFGDVGVGVREREVDGCRCPGVEEEKCPEAAGAQDWTGLD